MEERVTLLGTLPDGSTKVLGTVNAPPTMKMRDIVRNYIGEPHDDDEHADDEATVAMWILKDYHAWLVAQGWKAPDPGFIPVK